MGADLDGANGAVEEAGNFLVVEMLEAGEHEHLALFERQAGEGGAQQDEILGRGRLVGGRQVGGGVMMEIGRIGGRRRGGVLPEVIGGHFARDVVDPGGELALVAVGVPVFEDAVEDNLHEVLAHGRLVGQAHEETEERPVIALEQFAEPPDLSGAHGNHEFVIGEICHSCGEASGDGPGGNSELSDGREEHGGRA